MKPLGPNRPGLLLDLLKILCKRLRLSWIRPRMLRAVLPRWTIWRVQVAPGAEWISVFLI